MKSYTLNVVQGVAALTVEPSSTLSLKASAHLK